MSRKIKEKEPYERISALILRSKKRKLEKKALTMGCENTSQYLRKVIDKDLAE